MFNKNVFTQTDAVADLIKGINEADYKAKMEALKGNQHKIDKNKNNKIDDHDFKILRGEKKVNEEQVEEADTSVKIPTSTGTRVLGHRYGNAAKTHRDSLADPFAVVRGPGQKDMEALGKKMAKKEEIDPNVTTTDTLTGRVAGKSANPFLKAKVKLNVNEEELDEANTESKKEFLARQARLAAASAETAKDPARLKRMMNIPGYSAAMDLAKKTTTKEEVEELDELSKSTLGSYAKRASRDAVITRKIGADFENQAKKARSPGMKAASAEISQKYKEKSWKRRDGVDKAVDRLTKEEAKKEDPPFDGPYKKPDTKPGHGDASRVKHLAKMAIPKTTKEEVELDEAINDNMHPTGVALLKHIKPEHHNLYKPHLTTDVFNGSFKDRHDVLSAAKQAGHLREDIGAMQSVVEVNVMSMKKNLAGFKARYGKDAKSVMYATATKQAKED